MDVFDVEAGRAGALRTVSAIDPFRYPRTGDPPNYPRTLTVSIAGATVTAEAHLWPARSNAPEFRIHGAPPAATSRGSTSIGTIDSCRSAAGTR